MNAFNDSILDINNLYEVGLKGVLNVPRTPLNIFSDIVSGKNYLYGKTAPNIQIHDYVSLVDIREIKQHIENPITVEGRKFCDSIDIIVNEREQRISLGGIFELYSTDKSKMNLHYEFPSDLDKGILALRFIIDLITKGNFSIKSSKDHPIEVFKKKYEAYQATAHLLDLFHVDHKKIDMRGLSRDAILNLNFLINYFVDEKKPRSFAIEKSGFVNFKIDNITIGLLAIIDDENSKLYNVFNSKKSFNFQAIESYKGNPETVYIKK